MRMRTARDLRVSNFCASSRLSGYESGVTVGCFIRPEILLFFSDHLTAYCFVFILECENIYAFKNGHNFIRIMAFQVFQVCASELHSNVARGRRAPRVSYYFECVLQEDDADDDAAAAAGTSDA